MMNLSAKNLLGLLQWCDSLFPAGAYAHSFGLEEAVRDGTVRNGRGLFEWIRARLTHSTLSGECILLRRAYEAAGRKDFDTVRQCDAEGLAMRLPRESHEGGRATGRRFIQIAADLYPSGWMDRCLEALANGQLRGDPAVAFALAACASERALVPTLVGYLYGIASAQISAGLRLLPMGQGEGQRILDEIWEMLDKVGAPENILQQNLSFSFQPALEIRGMRHETAEMRLFQS